MLGLEGIEIGKVLAQGYAEEKYKGEKALLGVQWRQRPGSTRQPTLKMGLSFLGSGPHASHQVEQGRQERALHPSSAPWCLETARQEAGRTGLPRSSLEESGGVMSCVSRWDRIGLPLGCDNLGQGASSFRASILFYTLLFYLSRQSLTLA